MCTIDNVEGVAECMEGVVEEGDEEGVVEEGDEVSAEVEDMEGVEPVAVDTPDGVAPGPTSDLTGKEPVEVFQELLTSPMVQSILDQTNMYGQQYVASHREHLQNHPRARAHDFIRRPFSLNEIYRYTKIIHDMDRILYTPFSHITCNMYNQILCVHRLVGAYVCTQRFVCSCMHRLVSV